MNILIISPTPFLPATAGNRARIGTMVKHLRSLGHRITFLLLDREATPPEALQEMAAACDIFYFAEHDRTKERRRDQQHSAIDDWYLDSDDEAVRGVLGAVERPDLVFIEYVFLSAALQHFAAPTIKVIDTHDVFANRAENLARLGLRSNFFSTSTAEENRGLSRADVVIAIHDADRRTLQGRLACPVITLGYWPDQTGGDVEEPRYGLKVGWIGSSNPLNLFALEKLFDALRGARPDAAGVRFIVAGSASEHLQAIPDWAEARGVVEDSSTFLATLDLFINPHVGGTGLKIKTVEALAAGRAIIGTATAFQGLPVSELWHLARDPAACAGFLQRWCVDPEFRILV